MRAVFLLNLLLLGSTLYSEEAPLPRTVVALYDSKSYDDLWYTNALQYVAMPSEHAGLVVDYCDIHDGLPEIKEDPAVIGVVIWDLRDIKGDIAVTYVKWLTEAIESGKKVALLNSFPPDNLDSDRDTEEAIATFWEKMGLEPLDWEGQTYSTKIVYEDPRLLGFERQYIGVLPPYPMMKVKDKAVTSHLTVNNLRFPNQDFSLIATGPNGGYVAEGYGLYKQYYGDRDYLRWYLNPFRFFSSVFKTDMLPKPDTTTMAGRRMYYSHIDGDGWNSITNHEKYRERKSISAEVILEEIIEPHPNLPVTVGPVGGEINLSWAGVPQSEEVAKRLFELEHVEMGCHTYSHPFDWGFFKNYVPQDEEPYLDKYPFGTWENDTLMDEIKGLISKEDGEQKEQREEAFHYPKKLKEGYAIPRAYANKPFDLKFDTQGAIQYTNTLGQKEKEVKVFQWSGNCQPFEEALKLINEVGIANINGGDTIFDRNYASYGWVRPLSRTVGKQRQIFSSMANENLYTELWTAKFYGFQQLVQTFQNTETPIRIKPLNLYYHMYSGEKLASLSALKKNVEFIEEQEIIPIETSRFYNIALGFYSTQFFPVGEKKWKVANRGALQTIRFDKAVFLGVDFENSKGVVGQRHLQGSLYVYLDEAVDTPIIALKEIEDFYQESASVTPYLISSRWRVYDVEGDSEKWSFTTSGYGLGEMLWRVPNDGMYSVTIDGIEMVRGTDDSLLRFAIGGNALKLRNVVITKKDND